MRNRPITAVHPDIARFAWEVSKVSGDSKESTERLRGIWLTELAECLVTRDPSIHAYGALLLTEVEQYRKADSERKRGNSDSVESVESKDSVDSQPRAKQSRSKKSSKKIRSTQGGRSSGTADGERAGGDR